MKKWILYIPISIFLSGCSYKGHIVDGETHQPLPDVFVLGIWKTWGFHGTVCYAVENAITDTNGYYILNPPVRALITNNRPNVFAYKSGYRLKTNYKNSGHVIVVSPLHYPKGKLFKNNLDNLLRLKYLHRLTVVTHCYGAGSDNNNKLSFFKGLLNEAITLASTSEHYEIVNKICEATASVATRGSWSSSSKEADIKINRYVRKELPQCLSFNVDKDEKKWIFRRLVSGNVGKIKEAINAGYNIDTRFDKHNTALAITALKGDSKAMQALLEMGANPDAMDEDYQFILMQVVKNKNLQEQVKVDVINLLMKYGANPHAGNEWNHSSFNTAVSHCDKVAVSAMISNGANVNDSDLDGNEYGINYIRYPPLFYARCVDVIDILMNAGANLNLKGDQGRTALINSLYFGDISFIKLLIDKGVDVNAQEHSGMTALMRAVIHYKTSNPERKTIHYKIIKMLLESGADAALTNKAGKTAFDYAEDQKITRLLKRYIQQ